ncbi:hypothetical protein AURDEDRAFT_188694 [Auricularia subglabra TFB-10046 SS5]|uniref:Uncharacterized protein n=1 Tax=Auricularia subglabra (strain TFB-10046 / SS5) TaxID=717982 RepID=J0CXN5_AURST|nr:hypothetical protein AURDEDRAFT_188694 [Auricularia subglabra TFB-10046 SS5]
MDEPYSRVSVPFAFRFSDAVNGQWLPVTPDYFDSSNLRRTDPPEELHLITWVVDDFMPFHAQRIVAAIEALRDHLATCCEKLPAGPHSHRDSPATRIRAFAPPSLMPSPIYHKSSQFPAVHQHDNRCPAAVIFLQGLTADMLPIVLAHLWVCHNFIVSDITSDGLSADYTVALLDRRLARHARCFVRATLGPSETALDLLLVEIAMHGEKRMRLANTFVKTRRRKEQLPHQTRSTFMHQLAYIRKQLEYADGGVHAGTFRLFLQPLAAAATIAEVGLHDLWEPDSSGETQGDRMQHTWGHWPRESSMTDFAPQRASKFCTTGEAQISRGRVARLALDARCEIYVPGASGFAVHISDHCAMEIYLSLPAPAKHKGLVNGFFGRK